jgi:hypothetical protein
LSPNADVPAIHARPSADRRGLSITLARMISQEPVAGASAAPASSRPRFQVRDLPAPPRQLWRIIGPGIVGAGVALSSGEFILWPFIASQVGLVFVWGAVIGSLTQFFLNMEVERYTLATGETALSGFNRIWKHWGLALAIMVYFANLWPGWALSSATLLTYLTGGEPRIVAVVMLVIMGASLTLAPVVYVALERLLFVKLVAVALLAVLAVALAIQPESWQALPAGLVGIGGFPSELGFALLFGAMVFAGGGGGQNLCQSNWIRDKGFGMGQYVPRLVSPITGVDESRGDSGTVFTFEPTAANMARWNRWWRFANVEQLITFTLVTLVTICLTSMLAHSLLYGQPGLPNNVSFLRIEGERLAALVGGWFGAMFWAVGAFSLFGAAMGIIDYTSRLAADVFKSTYLRRSGATESQVYFWLVWGLVAIGCLILTFGVAQPIVLLVISASVSGAMMFVYSILLIIINRRELPGHVAIRSYRLWIMVWATLLFGVMASLTIYQQVRNLL